MRPIAVGFITLHLMFASILQLFPNRICRRCDGYIALEDCSELGQRYVLQTPRETFLVSVADCLDPADRQAHDRFWNNTWLADLDVVLWSGPEVPQKAALWTVADWNRYKLKLEKIE